MNPRIKELAEQAFQALNEVTTEGVADRYTFEQAWFQMYNQKFAELIVRECAELMYGRDEHGNCKDGDVIKKHFGVEDE